MDDGGVVTSLDDGDVMSHVRDGELEMLAILFERHHVRLFNFFLRLTGERSVSEDLVQELFLRILKYRHTYRSDGAFMPWAFRIARRLHLSHLRRQRPESAIDTLLDQAPAADETPVQRLERLQDEDLLRRALERLPLRKREILLLTHQQGLKYRDVAAIVGASLGAVKVQVHRAVADLRKTFLDLQGGAL